MDDNESTPTLGQDIRRLRQGRGWTLAELARRAGTSAPTLHRYENGWDRFEVDTLRRIASALGVRLEIRLIPPDRRSAPARPLSRGRLRRILAPLFWDRDLRESDLARHADWVLERVLTSGDREQVRAARAYFGDEAVRRAVRRRGVDPRTRRYWRLILGGGQDARESHRR
jgi:transcriptional regulator with XRE-family HTH domain